MCPSKHQEKRLAAFRGEAILALFSKRIPRRRDAGGTAKRRGPRKGNAPSGTCPTTFLVGNMSSKSQ